MMTGFQYNSDISIGDPQWLRSDDRVLQYPLDDGSVGF